MTDTELSDLKTAVEMQKLIKGINKMCDAYAKSAGIIKIDENGIWLYEDDFKRLFPEHIKEKSGFQNLDRLWTAFEGIEVRAFAHSAES